MESAVDGDGSCSPHCNACGLVWFDRDIETAITRGGGMRHDVVVDPDDRITDFEVGRGRTKAHPCHLDNMLGGRRRSRCGHETTKHRREIGRASWRERGCQDGEYKVVAGCLKKKHRNERDTKDAIENKKKE